MKCTDKVSIIIPTKNRCESLQEAVESIQAQTYSNWELLVVDDQSTDQSVERISELAASEPRIQLIQREGDRGGAPVCRNLGFRASTGPYVMFLDSDDLLAPTCLEKRVAAITDHPELDYVVFRAELFHSRIGDMRLLFNRDTGEDDLDRVLRLDIPWQTTGPLWRREAINKIGPWDEDLRNAQDVDFVTRALVKGLKYQRFPVRDYFIREGERGRPRIGNTCWSSAEYYYPHKKRLSKLHDMLKQSGKLDNNRRVLLSGNYLWLTECWLNNSMFQEAVKTWKEGRSKGLVGYWMYLQGLLYIMTRPFWFSSLWYYYLWHIWPEDMFVNTRGTIRKTPIDYDTPDSAVTFKTQRIPPYKYREIIQDGCLRYFSRRLMPKRILSSLAYRLRKWQFIR